MMARGSHFQGRDDLIQTSQKVHICVIFLCPTGPLPAPLSSFVNRIHECYSVQTDTINNGGATANRDLILKNNLSLNMHPQIAIRQSVGLKSRPLYVTGMLAAPVFKFVPDADQYIST
jgi:hypothetical protein